MSTYIYNDKEFHSIKQLSEYVNINEKTLTARLRKGMAIEDACKKIDLRCTYYLDNNIEKTLLQICKEQSKKPDLIRNRLKYGYSLYEAFNKPKKISKQGIPIVVNGILYNSIAAALKKLNLLHKESTIRRRLKSGMNADTAFNLEMQPGKGWL